MEEIYNSIDDIMEISHQITDYFITIAKANMEGIKVKGKSNIGIKEVEENKTIKILFERLQKKYRIIQENILNVSEMEKEQNEDLIIYGMIPVSDIETQIAMLDHLKDYVEQSYIDMRYVSILDDKDEVQIKSIYADKPFESMHNTEYILQQKNLDVIEERLSFNEKRPTLNFREKAKVLDDISKKRYYKNFSMKQVDYYIEEFKKSKELLDSEIYEEILAKLYEQKFIIIYEYMQDKYNGIIQENDIGKTGVIKKYIDDDNISIIINMPEDEIATSISQKISEYTQRLYENVLHIEGIETEIEEVEEVEEVEKVEKLEELEELEELKIGISRQDNVRIKENNSKKKPKKEDTSKKKDNQNEEEKIEHDEK